MGGKGGGEEGGECVRVGVGWGGKCAGGERALYPLLTGLGCFFLLGTKMFFLPKSIQQARPVSRGCSSKSEL
jgi:hypothetical protein